MNDPFYYAKTTPIEKLGMEGYCKVACEELLEMFPNATIHGFPNEETGSFEHVFLMQDGHAIDIKGVRTLDDVIADAKSETKAKKISRQELTDAIFISDGDPEEREIVLPRIKEHLEINKENFKL